MMIVSLDTTNINAVNISTLDFRIWQHFSSNWTSPYLQILTNVPEVPVAQLYKHMINTSEPIHSFMIKDDDLSPSVIWTILVQPWDIHRDVWYVFAVCIGVYCSKRFWIRPTIHRHQTYSPTLQHVIMEDDLEVAPI